MVLIIQYITIIVYYFINIEQNRLTKRLAQGTIQVEYESRIYTFGIVL
jgi:hypothetical protein